MTTEELLFCLLRNEIIGKELPTDIELTDKISQLYMLSKQHDIAHLIGDALLRNKLLPEGKAANAFREQVAIAVFRYERQNAEFERVSAALKEAKIPFIPLKGAEIRNLYLEPWMRTSCDIDILVKKEDYFATSKYLAKKLDYKIKDYNSHDVSLYSQGNVHIELHHALAEDTTSVYAETILKNVWDYSFANNNNLKYYMSDKMFYFYHIEHMAKHFKSGGCGIRPFIDLWLLNHKLEFDKSKRDMLLGEGGLLKFAQNCEKLSEVWLGNENNDETTALLQQFIVDGGVYGNMQNRVSVSKGTKKKKKLWSYIWKPYSELKYWYPNLSKYKCLLPFYEIKRWLTIIFCGSLTSKFKEKKILSNTETEERERIDKLISALGLKQD